MIYYNFQRDELCDSDYMPDGCPEYKGYPPALDGTTEDDWPDYIEKDLGWQKEQQENKDE